MPDHVHWCISIPSQYAVSNVVGYLKGKSAISIARKFKPESVGSGIFEVKKGLMSNGNNCDLECSCALGAYLVHVKGVI